jgi:hypothetical protein
MNVSNIRLIDLYARIGAVSSVGSGGINRSSGLPNAREVGLTVKPGRGRRQNRLTVTSPRRTRVAMEPLRVNNRRD